MFNKEELADIVKNQVENKIRSGEIHAYFNTYYYILFNGKMYRGYKYDDEVAEGKRSPNDIYAYVNVYTTTGFDTFLFNINYLNIYFDVDIVLAYLRKMGFTIVNKHVAPPTPNLKYFIYTIVGYNYDKLEYLGVNIYDIDSLARAFHIPQIVEQRLGNKPREITEDDAFDIKSIVDDKQPLLAGYTYYDAWYILREYFDFHKDRYKDEAYKIVLAYSQLFPVPYRVCYEWKAGIFVEIDCLKIERLRFSS